MTLFYPSHTRYAAGSENYLWLSVEPRELKYTGPWQNESGGGQNVGISSEKADEKMMFLAPQELQDNLTHNWEAMENILSRVQEKAAQAKRELRMATQQHKVDTALIYQDSNRREISFSINLSVYTDAQTDVYEPINKLRRYSSPKLSERTETQTKVGNPYIFRVNTVIGSGKIVPLINIKNASLTAIQPNYQGPFINGYPSLAEVTLTFKDMEPLSRETFENIGSRVRVG